MATPRAAVLTAPGRVAVEPVAARPLAPHESRVRVALAGICGTDLALFAGTLPNPLPLVLGHEFTGGVAEVGSPRDECWIGRRVCADINYTCLSRREAVPCRACRLGRPHHCQRHTVMGIIEAAGAFATDIIVPVPNLFSVPDRVGDERAIFAEPLAAALEAFEQVPVGPGDVVAVLGLGRLGALIAAVAHRRGATVLGIARSEERLRSASALGIGRTLRAGQDDLRRAIDELTEGFGADVVVEATGAPTGLAEAISLVRPRGTVILKTTCGLPAGGFDETKVVIDEISLVGSRCGPIGKALDLLASDPLPVETLLAETHPLEGIATALVRAEEVFKVAVRPEE